MGNMMNRILLILFIVMLFPVKSLAADKDGNFAVKGLALLPCATFVEEREKNSKTYAETMAWLTGFISGYNYLSTETYDVVPWQGIELLSLSLASHCAKNPDESFFHATNKLINTIAEDRLRTISEFITISVGDKRLVISKDIVFRIQSSLKEKGYLKVKWPTGEYDGPTVEAMKLFQAENKFSATGLPDQQSLLYLFTK